MQVYNVLAVTAESDDPPDPEHVCQNLNLCFPSESDAHRQSHGAPRDMKARSKYEKKQENHAGTKSRSKRDVKNLEGALKIVQLTDIHIDLHYAAVSYRHQFIILTLIGLWGV